MPQVLFGVLILMAITVVGICVTKSVDQGQGFDHPGYPKKTIRQAPDGYERHATIVVVTGCYGTLTAIFTVFCMVFGLTKHQKQGVAARVLVVAGLVYAGLFSLVVILYWNGLHTTISDLFGFPASTAMMLFVFGPSPIVLVLFYMFTFFRIGYCCRRMKSDFAPWLPSDKKNGETSQCISIAQRLFWFVSVFIW